jgi:tryptophan-rich sensory protein
MIETFWAQWTGIAVAAGWAVVIAIAGAIATDVGPWYEKLRFPAIRPPNWLFGPAWTLIFSLTATAGVIAWNAAPDVRTRQILIALYAINGLLNIAWSPLFFRLRRPDWAFIELIPFWLSVLALIVLFAPFAPRAAWLLSPYIAWVTFAGWLNWRIVQLNSPFVTRRKEARER